MGMAHNADLEIGRNVRAEMARRGVTQSSLATHLGINQTAVSARLRGGTAWRVTELAAVAEFLDVSLDSLTQRAGSAA